MKYYRSAFNALHEQYRRTKNLVSSISNYEAKMRQRIRDEALKNMLSFSKSKGMALEQRKKKGTQDLLALVKQAYLKNLSREFNRYKAKCLGDNQKASRLSVVWNKFHSLRRRDAFDWWRRKTELMELAQDLHDTGPVRAEYWQAQRDIENMKEFLRKEKYTEGEIDMIYNGVCTKNEGLMKKYMIRMRIARDQDQRLLPIVWQRWREYVAVRKSVRYQFRICHNQVQDGVADLQRAFKKWRNGPDQLAEELWRLPVDTIVQLGIRTTKDLDECGDQIAENSSIQNHLMMQRDEFLNYYIKGQILAMGYLKDRIKFVTMQGVSRWLWAGRKMAKIDYEREIRDAAYLHANLEQREQTLNDENEKLIAENSELSQFTEDGTVIRRNLDRLKQETSKIAERIAETDDDYQELLERNAELIKLVEEAEAKAAAQDPTQGRFANLPQMKEPKQSEEQLEAKNQKPETSAEKKQRERFERLAKLNQGAAIR